MRSWVGKGFDLHHQTCGFTLSWKAFSLTQLWSLTGARGFDLMSLRSFCLLQDPEVFAPSVYAGSSSQN